ncbi:MAG: DeoR/GlpR family DNA-binding transcription regulator [Verrucomicrobiota bacterium]
MLAPQRQEKILGLLEKHGTLRTVDLAESFEVTDETIRRDLIALADTGQLMKIHGGASSLSGKPKPQSFIERSLINIDRKDAIARAALKLIKPGNTYAFDSSTTAMSLVSKLPDLNLRVISNAFSVFEQLGAKENIELISTGGQFHKKTRTFVNANLQQSVGRYHLNCALISCIGFNFKSGAGEAFEAQTTYKEFVIHQADQVVLLIDSSKFERQSDYYFASANQIHRIITDWKIDQQIARRIQETGIELTIAE